MTIRPLMTILIAAALAGAVHAAPADQRAMDAAQARYDSDRNMCNDEKNPGHRMQCMRDAKAEYERAVGPAKASGKQAKGADTGRVLGVRTSEKKGDSNALGLIAGGAAGALLGHQVGGGTGRDVATVAGAVGGAYAGKKIQEKANSSTIWTVDVEYDNGHRAAFQFDRDPGLKQGDRVHNANGSIARQ